MAKEYQDLYNMLRLDHQALQYFAALPGYVQETMSQRAQEITNAELLHDYAENLTRGDN